MFDQARNKVANLISGKKSFGSVRFDVFPDLRINQDTRNLEKPERFYEESLYLNKAIDKRAEVLSGIQLTSEDSNIDDLLRKPNNLLKGRDLIGVIQKHFDIYGEFYLYKEGSTTNGVRALHIIHPNTIKPVIEQGEVIRYETNGKGPSYQPDEIIWQHRPDPRNPQKPLSLISDASKETLRAEIELRRYQAKMARSGGRFNSIISLDGDVTEEQLHKAKERYEQQLEQAKNSRAGQRPFFAGGKINVQNLQHSPKELDYLNSKDSIIEEISTITGVPKTILSSFTDVKYSNAEEARITFLKETIKPLIEILTDTLSEGLGKEITYEDFIPEDHEEKMERIKTAFDVAAMTPNEAREELGMEERSEGEADKLFINMNKLPIDENTTQSEN